MLVVVQPHHYKLIAETIDEQIAMCEKKRTKPKNILRLKELKELRATLNNASGLYIVAKRGTTI